MVCEDLNVLVSACNSPSIPGIIKCLKDVKERDIKVIGIDMKGDPSTIYVVDVFYEVPPVNSSNYCDEVLDICIKENVKIYIPGISEEVSLLSKRKMDFTKNGILLAISDDFSVEIANNKYETYKFMEQMGLKVPKYKFVSCVQDFVDGCNELGYPNNPVCVKIVNGSGSRGVRIIDPRKSLYDLFIKEKANSLYTSYDYMLSILQSVEKIDDMILLEYLEGPEYTVDLLASNGNVLYECGRENVVSLLSIAQESVLKEDKVAYDVCEKIVKKLNFDGNIGFDFMRDKHGYPILTDINPRITATISVIAAGGLNLVYLRIKQMLGEQLPQCIPAYGTHIKRRYGEIYTSPNGNLINSFNDLNYV